MQIFTNTETIFKQCFAYFTVKLQRCNLFQEVSALSEQKMILPQGYCGLVYMRFSALIAKSQLHWYQSLHQRIFLRLKGVNLLWSLFISLGRSTDTFQNNIPIPWPLVEYLLRLESLQTKWDPCTLFGQIRYTMEKQRVIMTSDNQQTSLTCICNLGGKGSQITPSPLNPSGADLD